MKNQPSRPSDPALTSFPWRCEECGGAISVSYEELAQVGSPLCGQCDVEMTLLTPWKVERARSSEEPQEDHSDG